MNSLWVLALPFLFQLLPAKESSSEGVPMPEVQRADVASQTSVDHILLDFGATDAMRTRLRWSIFPMEGEIHLIPGMIQGIQNKREGTGTLVRCGGKPRILFPAWLAEGADQFYVLLPNEKQVRVRILGKFNELPIGVGEIEGLPKKAKALPWAESQNNSPVGIVITQLGRKGYEVLSRVHRMGYALPPLEEYEVTDIRSHGGFPFLTAKERVLGIPFRPWFSPERTLMTPAHLLKSACARPQLELVAIQAKSLEINP